MKPSLFTAVALTCVCSMVLPAAAKPAVPTLELLTSFVGADPSSREFKKFLEDYEFSENPKRDNSWGSSFGVLLEVSEGRVNVGMRTPSQFSNVPTYCGTLPKGLKADDPIERIQVKLGKPLSVAHDPRAYYEMEFEGMTVCTLGGVLSEVWLRPTKGKPAAKAGR